MKALLILSRIAALPFWAALHILQAIRHFLLKMYQFARFGGENITYDSEINRMAVYEFYSLLRHLSKDQNNWIAISDEKPPSDGWVLLAHDKDGWIDIGEMQDDGTFESIECQIHPTHWRHLPPPPKCNE